MKKISQVAVVAAIVICIIVCFVQPAFSFCVRNQSSVVMKTWVYPGNFSKNISPGEEECCNWQDKGCNPSGISTDMRILCMISQDDKSHFSQIIPLQASGYASIKEKDRSSLGVPTKNLYVESFLSDKLSIVSSPYGVDMEKGKRKVHFLVTADPQYFDDSGKHVHGPESDAVIAEMVKRLASTCESDSYFKYPTPYLAGCEIRGILVAGDLTMQSKETEISWYNESAINEKTRFVYDGLGNHDYNSEHIKNFIIQDRTRDTVASSVSSPHYSWDWHDVHFVQLNLFPGNGIGNTEAKLDPFGSLTFLQQDLKDNVGTTGRPVVIIQHYGFDSFSEHVNTTTNLADWWTDDQRKIYWDAIAPYNIKAIFTGHIHLTETDKWTWHTEWPRPKGSTGGPQRIDTFVAGAALYGLFLDVMIDEHTMTVQRWAIHPAAAQQPYLIDTKKVTW